MIAAVFVKPRWGLVLGGSHTQGAPFDKLTTTMGFGVERRWQRVYHAPFLAEHRWEVSCAVNDAGDVDAVGDGMVEDHVWFDDKHSEVLAEVVTSLAEFGLVRESFQRLEDFVEHIVSGA